MKAVIAIDSFKGSLSSLCAAAAVKEAMTEVFPEGEALVFPIADGGEGTVDALVKGLSGKECRVSVSGPLGKRVEAVYGIIDGTAVMEMAAAAGLPLLTKEERNPLYTTTRGVGEMILDALDSGCRSFIIGIGGSATNDGGSGMLKALGFGLFDSKGKEIPDGAIGLSKIARISTEGVRPELYDCKFSIACDVKNPLCGELGCSAVFGPQKGADEKSVALMDSYLEKFLCVTKSLFPDADGNFPGSGAAGGLGFAFRTFLFGELKPGISLILDKIGIEEEIKDADIVITGEGRLDSQTVMGKAPSGVAAIAKKYGVPTVAFAGALASDAEMCNEGGIDAFFPIIRKITSLEEAMDENTARENLKATAKQVFLLLKSFKGL